LLVVERAEHRAAVDRRHDALIDAEPAALAARAEHGLGAGAIEWLPSEEHVLALRNSGVTVLANTGSTPVPLPVGDVVLASGPVDGATLPGDTTVWLRAD